MNGLSRGLRPAILFGATALFAAFILSGCGGSGGLSNIIGTAKHTGGGGGGSTTPAVVTYQGTSAPGDAWSWKITHSSGTFAATNSADGYTYAGSYAKMASGFDKLDVTSTTDTNITVPAYLYGYEVPGTLYMAKPIGANTHPIVAAYIGTNPIGPVLNFNYIRVPELNYNPDTEAAYGTATLDVSGSSLTGTMSPMTITGSALPSVPLALDCTDGLISGGQTSVTGGITPNGIAILDNGVGLGGAMLVPTATAALPLSTLCSQNWQGMHDNPADGSLLCWAIPTTTVDTLKFGFYTNPDTGVKSASYGTITFSGQPSPGLFTGTVYFSQSAKTCPAEFVVNFVNGKYVMFGVIRHWLGSGHFALVSQ
jgi:hypothetical protein